MDESESDQMMLKKVITKSDNTGIRSSSSGGSEATNGIPGPRLPHTQSFALFASHSIA